MPDECLVFLKNAGHEILYGLNVYSEWLMRVTKVSNVSFQTISNEELSDEVGLSDHKLNR